jgi:hypothetical protein
MAYPYDGDRIVYVLGAGFSAPLGLPVVSNFIQKACDIYARDHNRYQDFGQIYEMIDEMSGRVKHYYTLAERNVEEILSILEMRSLVDRSVNVEKEKFQHFSSLLQLQS